MSGRLKINYFSDGLFIVLVFLCPPYFQASYKKGLENKCLYFGRIQPYDFMGKCVIVFIYVKKH